MFSSELDRLDWVIGEIDVRTRDGLTVHYPDDAAFDVAVVATAWLRLAIAYGRGLQRLLHDGLPDAAAPLNRALLELWADFRYLLRHGSRQENAIKVEINAVIELTEFLARNASTQPSRPPSTRRGPEHYRADLQLAHPAIFATVTEQRARRRFHWSGLGRLQLLDAVDGPGAREMYGVLSWYSHAVMNVIRDVDLVDPATGSVRFAAGPDPEDWAEQTAYQASGTLFYFWNEYARLTSGEEITPPASGE